MTETASPTVLTQHNFQAFMGKAEGLLLIDWWAPWCGPCRVFAPVFEKAAARHPEVRFAKVNTQDEPELAQAFAIHAIPTLMVIRDGVMLYAEAGALPAAALDDLIAQAQGLDMAEVKRKAQPMQ